MRTIFFLIWFVNSEVKHFQWVFKVCGWGWSPPSSLDNHTEVTVSHPLARCIYNCSFSTKLSSENKYTVIEYQWGLWGKLLLNDWISLVQRHSGDTRMHTRVWIVHLDGTQKNFAHDKNTSRPCLTRKQINEMKWCWVVTLEVWAQFWEVSIHETGGMPRSSSPLLY